MSGIDAPPVRPSSTSSDLHEGLRQHWALVERLGKSAHISMTALRSAIAHTSWEHGLDPDDPGLRAMAAMQLEALRTQADCAKRQNEVFIDTVLRHCAVLDEHVLGKKGGGYARVGRGENRSSYGGGESRSSYGEGGALESNRVRMGSDDNASFTEGTSQVGSRRVSLDGGEREGQGGEVLQDVFGSEKRGNRARLTQGISLEVDGAKDHVVGEEEEVHDNISPKLRVSPSPLGLRPKIDLLDTSTSLAGDDDEDDEDVPALKDSLSKHSSHGNRSVAPVSFSPPASSTPPMRSPSPPLSRVSDSALPQPPGSPRGKPPLSPRESSSLGRAAFANSQSRLKKFEGGVAHLRVDTDTSADRLEDSSGEGNMVSERVGSMERDESLGRREGSVRHRDSSDREDSGHRENFAPPKDSGEREDSGERDSSSSRRGDADNRADSKSREDSLGRGESGNPTPNPSPPPRGLLNMGWGLAKGAAGAKSPESSTPRSVRKKGFLTGAGGKSLPAHMEPRTSIKATSLTERGLYTKDSPPDDVPFGPDGYMEEEGEKQGNEGELEWGKKVADMDSGYIAPPVSYPKEEDAGASSKWECNVCTLENFSWSRKCGACESPRPITSHPMPNIRNDRTVAKRASIQRGKSVGGPPSSLSPRLSAAAIASEPVVNWSCGVCTLVNDLAVRKCAACGHPRGADANDAGQVVAAVPSAPPARTKSTGRSRQSSTRASSVASASERGDSDDNQWEDPSMFEVQRSQASVATSGVVRKFPSEVGANPEGKFASARSGKDVFSDTPLVRNGMAKKASRVESTPQMGEVTRSDKGEDGGKREQPLERAITQEHLLPALSLNSKRDFSRSPTPISPASDSRDSGHSTYEATPSGSPDKFDLSQSSASARAAPPPPEAMSQQLSRQRSPLASPLSSSSSATSGVRPNPAFPNSLSQGVGFQVKPPVGTSEPGVYRIPQRSNNVGLKPFSGRGTPTPDPVRPDVEATPIREVVRSVSQNVPEANNVKRLGQVAQSTPHNPSKPEGKPAALKATARTLVERGVKGGAGGGEGGDNLFSLISSQFQEVKRRSMANKGKSDEDGSP
eukprot:TRINITY_DN1045_c0_g2_i1.p1 TRINITY_DN1045_c0_g2~~TRINITY_DN1045_c0_g2_i1.p1  ORF type:complete len:1080 (-),score=129.36 TRINITY_DN1045_c0_g2_i1:198-3437(-)